ncbi:hypothetical protein DL771_007999 [Monosporascus sp. 5C6A]|nr:hypothetical protein DL771_007999 [Monosporascus sp. 5C6A]
MDTVPRLFPAGIPVSLQVIAATVVLGFLYSLITKERPFSGFPVISIDGKSPRKTWLFNGRKALAEGVQRFAGPFQVVTGTGPKIVLPNRYADEIRNHPSLSFNKAFAKDFFVNYPGFEPHRQGLTGDGLIQEMIRVKLTQSLNLVTDDLVEETTASLHDIFGESEEWKTFLIRDAVADLVARLSSRVFLGKNLCRNKRWLVIAKTFTIDSFVVSHIMRAAPPFMRPITYWLLPQSKRLRKAVRDSRAMIEPELERRKAVVEAALADGKKPQKTADTLGWMYEIAKSRNLKHFDYSASQLSLAMAAIHTTTEITGLALLDICEYPEIAEQLRQEIIEVLSEGGWAKTSLYKLKLMDSFLKEGQRLHPLNTVSMSRYVEKDTELSDGTILPQGSRVMVAGSYMDPTIYPDPERFDAARFLHMRQQPGQENNWQFVTTTPAHLVFGHGQHACPGRFFASMEVKVTLCHLLLKYDWRFLPGEGRPTPRAFEAGQGVHPSAKVQARRRKPEIDIDNL